MTHMPSKLGDVVSALEALELPYVLYREESGLHRILIEGSSKTVVENALADALRSQVFEGIDVVDAEDDDETVRVDGGADGTRIVIAAQSGTGKSAASMLWWLALQEGSKAARAVAHADMKPANVALSDKSAGNDDPA
jgi:hypothetical protein